MANYDFMKSLHGEVKYINPITDREILDKEEKEKVDNHLKVLETGRKKNKKLKNVNFYRKRIER
jgi:hypothetical protein